MGEDRYIEILTKIQLFLISSLCFLGIHDWVDDRVMKYLTKGEITQRCFYCNKKNKKEKKK